MNARMKNFCKQKDIGLIDNCNLEEHHLGAKKLHVNNKGNSAFAKNILRFIESWIAIVDIFDEIRVRYTLKDKPQSKLFDMKDSGEVKDLAYFRKCNQNKLVIAHMNINSLRNKFELLTEKTKGNVDISLISETKIDERFPGTQFKIDGLATPIE